MIKKIRLGSQVKGNKSYEKLFSLPFGIRKNTQKISHS